MNELAARVRRIVGVEIGLIAAGTLGFLWWKGFASSGAFLAAALVSLTSFVVLAWAAKLVGGGSFNLLLGILLLGRFFVYAAVISAILKVYPGRDLELLLGLLVSVASILIEAIFSAYQDART